MVLMKPSALFALFLISCLPAMAGPESLKVTFEAEKDRDKGDMVDDKMGSGDKIATRYNFQFQVENLATEEYRGIEARVYVVVAPHDWQKDSVRKVFKVLEKKDIVVEKQGVTRLDMGTADIVITNSAKGNTFWRSGWEYQGYVAELSMGGQVFYTDSKGGSDTTKAVTAYLKNPTPLQK